MYAIRSYYARAARVGLDGLPDRARERLEHRLDDVVGVGSCEHPHVQRHVGVAGQRLEKLLEELYVHLPHLAGLEARFVGEVGAARAVERRLGELV